MNYQGLEVEPIYFDIKTNCNYGVVGQHGAHSASDAAIRGADGWIWFAVVCKYGETVARRYAPVKKAGTQEKIQANMAVYAAEHDWQRIGKK